MVTMSNLIDLQYLGSFPRIGNSTRIDYYYRCRTHGNSLQWRVNSEDAGSHSDTDTVGKVRYRSESNGEDIRYLSMLLSRKSSNDSFCLEAMLMISHPSIVDLITVCRGDKQQQAVQNSPPYMSSTIKTKDSVRMDVMLHDIDEIDCSRHRYNTYILVCDVSGTSQTWLVDKKSSGGFVTQNSLGTEVVQHRNNDEALAYTEAILIANRQSKLILTALLVLSNKYV